jgi:hypothetical protein
VDESAPKPQPVYLEDGVVASLKKSTPISLQFIGRSETLVNKPTSPTLSQMLLLKPPIKSNEYTLKSNLYLPSIIILTIFNKYHI